MLGSFSTNAPIDEDRFASHAFGVCLCRIGGFVSEPFHCMITPNFRHALVVLVGFGSKLM